MYLIDFIFNIKVCVILEIEDLNKKIEFFWLFVKCRNMGKKFLE